LKTYTQEDIDEYYEDEPEPIFCPLCLKRGYQIRLGPKILLPNEPRPDDYENFLECATCGWICPIYEVEKEATINDTIETIDNPFENKNIIQSLPKRKSKTGKKIAARGRKRKRDKNKLHDDPDINLEMRRHGDRVNVVYDSNP
jgi:hypothetical protein